MSDFIKKIFNCVLKMDKSLTGLDVMRARNDYLHFWENHLFNMERSCTKRSRAAWRCDFCVRCVMVG